MAQSISFYRRGYGRKWIALSRAFREQYPFCLGCWAALRLTVDADVVDHIQPAKGNQTLLLDEANLQPACKWHHDVVKSILERMFRERKIGEAELNLDSPTAIRLTKQLHRPSIGPDGFAVFGT